MRCHALNIKSLAESSGCGVSFFLRFVIFEALVFLAEVVLFVVVLLTGICSCLYPAVFS